MSGEWPWSRYSCAIAWAIWKLTPWPDTKRGRGGILAAMRVIPPQLAHVIAQIIQKDSQNQDDHLAEVVVITSKVREGDFKTAVQELSNKSSVKRISKTIRVYRK